MYRIGRQVSFFIVGVCGYIFLKTFFIINNDSPTVTSRDYELKIEVSTVTHNQLGPLPPTTEDSCSWNQMNVLPRTAREKHCSICKEFTCKNFFEHPSDSALFSDARKWMTAHPTKLKNTAHFINLTKDCDTFLNSQGYILEPVNQEEAEYPIAFNLIVHRDISQIERLLRSVYRPQNEYCIHIDSKEEGIYEALKSITRCFTNVRIASKLEQVNYAGFSRLKADINCMNDLVKNSNTQWNYLLNLAGQAFPLKTNLEMVQTLKIYNGSNDIEGIYRRILKGRFEFEWLEPNATTKGGIKKTGKRNPNPPFNIEIVRGSAYGIFSRKFVEYILDSEPAKALLEWSKKTWSPDEHYWATLHHLYSNPHLKTPGGFPGFPDSKPWLAVYAAWGGRDKCAGMWRHGVCVFGIGDLRDLLKRKEFIANKFYEEFQTFALDCMEEYLNYKIRCPQPINRTFYESLPFIRKNLYPWKH